MDDKTLAILEFPKILEQLASYCSFAVSIEKARALRPTADGFEARQRQKVTAEALHLLVTHPDLGVGGPRDVRGPIDLALHGGALAPNELLDVKYTLIASRNLARTFERLAPQYPYMADIAAQLPPPLGLVDAVSRAISERGEILDSASDKLGTIRRDLRVIHDRLMTKLQKMVSDPRNAPYLQEALITQRDGRYVIPLRSEFKGRIRSIVHDQSASGATLFIEPLGVVEHNNQYRELQLAERDEERRILSELSHQVALHAEEITQAMQITADLDLALACGKYAEDLHAVEPGLHNIPQEPTGQRSVIRLYQARHPLLKPAAITGLWDQAGGSTPVGDAKPPEVVPIDVELDPQTYVMVVTGPNTGGKTVALKTVGLLALMAQAGLHIPAHSGSEISVFDMVYADIGDEQSIEQSLSTFSGHITNIIRILEKADRRSLVILDELGAGTDPQEGAALARAILAYLVEHGVTTLVTTHHPELKAFAHATPGMVNACVEFDLETLRPTYRLTIGLPGRSNALAIAERLGLPADIIQSARSEIHPDDLRAETLLDEIHHQRELARQARFDAEKARQEIESLHAELSLRLEKIEDERRVILEQARQEGSQQIEALEDELAQTRKILARARQPVDVLREVEDKVEELKEDYDQPVERLEAVVGGALEKLERERRRAIRLGDRVRLRNLGAQGVVTALGVEEAEVQVGVLRVRARLSDLELPSPSGATTSVAGGQPAKASRLASRALERTKSIEGERPRASRKGPPQSFEEPDTGVKITYQKPGFVLPESPGIELDLRGKRADDALEDLERYLDAAFLAGLPFVRIIHGKGTGKLRDVVRQALHGHPHIRSFEGGGEKEGGEGVTVVKMATTAS
jgi:DNA mismatch repair protein MutS2